MEAITPDENPSTDSVAMATAAARSLRRQIEDLIAAAWEQRWAMLERDERLLHESVAHLCDARGEPLLAFIVKQLATREIGVPRIATVFPLLQAAYLIGLDEGPVDLIEGLNTVDSCLKRARDNGDTFLLQPAITATKRIAPLVEGQDQSRLYASSWALLILASKVQAELIPQAFRLATEPPTRLWEELNELKVEISGFLVAAELLNQHAGWFHPRTSLSAQADDLVELLRAASQRGAQAAIQQHQMVLDARASVAPENWLNRFHRCHQVVSKLGAYHRSQSCRWVLKAALEPARVLTSMAGFGDHNRAVALSVQAAIWTDAVEEGLLAMDALARVEANLREAMVLAQHDSSSLAIYVSELASVIQKRADLGDLSVESLREAVSLHRKAVNLAGDEERESFAQRLAIALHEGVSAGVLHAGALNEALEIEEVAYDRAVGDDQSTAGATLGNSQCGAVLAGVLPVSEMSPALELLRDAASTPVTNAREGARRLSCLAIRTAEAVHAGLIPPQELPYAVDKSRAAVALVPEEALYRLTYISNLACLIAEAVDAGQLPQTAITESLDLHREVLNGTPAAHPRRGVHASNLACRLFGAVKAGLVPPEDRLEALALMREAEMLTPVGHPNRSAILSNLALVLPGGDTGTEDYALAVRESVVMLREALSLTPPGHPDRVRYLISLGDQLHGAVVNGVFGSEVLLEAIQLHREALQLTSAGQEFRAAAAASLAMSLRVATDRLGLIDSTLLEVMSLQLEALSLTPTHHSARCSRISQYQITVAEAQSKEVISAEDSVRETLRLVDEFWDIISRQGVTPAVRRAMLADAQGLVMYAPIVMINAGCLQEAVRVIESLRGHLQRGKRPPSLPLRADLPKEVVATYEHAAERYRAAQQIALEVPGYISGHEAATTELLDAVALVRASGLNDFSTRPSLAAVSACLELNTLGIYLLSDERTGYALLVDRSGQTRLVVLPGLTDAAVHKHAVSVLNAGAAQQAVCEWIWDAAVSPILQVAGNFQRWLTVPTGYCGYLPWHAAGSEARGYIDDKVCVSETSSLTAIATTAQMPKAMGPPVFAMSQAADLVFQEADAIVAQALMHDVVVAVESGVEGVIRGMLDARQAVISGHGLRHTAQGAALQLVGGLLTVEAIERLPRRLRGTAVLSACSAGHVATDLPDEAIGLPAAFLSVGFTGILSSLWPVGDAVAFVTVARLLQEQFWGKGELSAEDLRRTRRWLRTATSQDLLAWLEDLQSMAPIPRDASRILTRWWRIHPDEGRPLADPADWGAFFFVGG